MSADREHQSKQTVHISVLYQHYDKSQHETAEIIAVGLVPVSKIIKQGLIPKQKGKCGRKTKDGA